MDAIAGLLNRGTSNSYNLTAFYSQKSVKEGWLRKQGGMIKTWQRRWFVIKGDMMYYFAKEDDSKPLGNILLPGNKVTVHSFQPNEPDKYLFEIIPGCEKAKMAPNHETYLISASCEEERNDWLKVLTKVMFANKGGAIFGQSIEETVAFQCRTLPSSKVPQIVELCVKFIKEHGIDAEGIFRLPGRTLLIKEYREAFDQGRIPDLVPDSIDIHTVASLLKLYLRELPGPLIPLQYYENIMKIVTRDLFVNSEKGYEDLSDLLTHLPHHNYNLLRYLCEFLKEVGSHEAENKMSNMNLAKVFVMSFIRPEDEDPVLLMGTADGRTNVTYTLINHCDYLFKLDYTEHGQAVQVEQILDLNEDQESLPSQSNTKTNRQSLIEGGRNNLHNDLAGLDLNQNANISPDSAEVIHVVTNSESWNEIDENEPIYHEAAASVFDSQRNQLKRQDTNGSEAEHTYYNVAVTPEGKPDFGRFHSRDSSVSDCSVISESEILTLQEETLDTLNGTDLTQYSREELLVHIQCLTETFQSMKDLYKTDIKNTKSKLCQVQGKHKIKMAEMAKKLDGERKATGDAVERVMLLQDKILRMQQYEHGPLT